MTDQEVIEMLASREGAGQHDWSTPISEGQIGFIPQCRKCCISYDECGYDQLCIIKRLPPYLTSRDAIQPVLAGLTDEEWALFLDQLVGAHQGRTNRSIGFSQFILTLPNDYLARAVAEVLKGGK